VVKRGIVNLAGALIEIGTTTRMTKSQTFRRLQRGHRFPPEIIAYAVWCLFSVFLELVRIPGDPRHRFRFDAPPVPISSATRFRGNAPTPVTCCYEAILYGYFRLFWHGRKPQMKRSRMRRYETWLRAGSPEGLFDPSLRRALDLPRSPPFGAILIVPLKLA